MIAVSKTTGGPDLSRHVGLTPFGYSCDAIKMDEYDVQHMINLLGDDQNSHLYPWLQQLYYRFNSVRRSALNHANVVNFGGPDNV